MLNKEILVFIPVYNECANLKVLIPEILKVLPEATILVVDDDSPDGTPAFLREYSLKNIFIKNIIRKDTRGRGLAGREGFQYAIVNNFGILVEMDGDLSHNPKFIPALLDKLISEQAGVVIGSRFMREGKDEERNFIRKAISNFARKYLNFFLGLEVSDPTSGFRVFRTEVLKEILPELKASDPFIVTESLYFVRKKKIKITECPIEFYSRKYGASKLKMKTLFKYLAKVALFAWKEKKRKG